MRTPGADTEQVWPQRRQRKRRAHACTNVGLSPGTTTSCQRTPWPQRLRAPGSPATARRCGQNAARSASIGGTPEEERVRDRCRGVRPPARGRDDSLVAVVPPPFPMRGAGGWSIYAARWRPAQADQNQASQVTRPAGDFPVDRRGPGLSSEGMPFHLDEPLGIDPCVDIVFLWLFAPSRSRCSDSGIAGWTSGCSMAGRASTANSSPETRSTTTCARS